MQFVPLSQAFPFMHSYACFDVSGNVHTHLAPTKVVLKPDLENNFLCLILSGDRGGLQ